jgi:hypothetical protein
VILVPTPVALFIYFIYIIYKIINHHDHDAHPSHAAAACNGRQESRVEEVQMAILLKGREREERQGDFVRNEVATRNSPLASDSDNSCGSGRRSCFERCSAGASNRSSGTQQSIRWEGATMVLGESKCLFWASFSKE